MIVENTKNKMISYCPFKEVGVYMAFGKLLGIDILCVCVQGIVYRPKCINLSPFFQITPRRSAYFLMRLCNPLTPFCQLSAARGPHHFLQRASLSQLLCE